MKKYLIITMAVLAAIAWASCAADDGNDYDPDFEGSKISFKVVDGESYSWGENRQSRAIDDRTGISWELTLKARKNLQTDSPYITITVSTTATTDWQAVSYPDCDIEVAIPLNTSGIDETYTGKATVVLTKVVSTLTEKVEGTFTATDLEGEADSSRKISITNGVINLKIPLLND